LERAQHAPAAADAYPPHVLQSPGFGFGLGLDMQRRSGGGASAAAAIAAVVPAAVVGPSSGGAGVALGASAAPSYGITGGPTAMGKAFNSAIQLWTPRSQRQQGSSQPGGRQTQQQTPQTQHQSQQQTPQPVEVRLGPSAEMQPVSSQAQAGRRDVSVEPVVRSTSASLSLSPRGYHGVVGGAMHPALAATFMPKRTVRRL